MIVPTHLYLFRWVKGARSMNILEFARQRLRQVDNLLQERQDDRHIRSRDCDIISFQFVICSRKKKFLADLTPPKQEAIAKCLTRYLFFRCRFYF